MHNILTYVADNVYFFNVASAVCSFLNKTLYVCELKMLQWQNNNKASKLQFTLVRYYDF